MTAQRDRDLKRIIEKLSEEAVAGKKETEKQTQSQLRVLETRHSTQLAECERLIAHLKTQIKSNSLTNRDLDESHQELARQLQHCEHTIIKQQAEITQLTQSLARKESLVPPEDLESLRRQERQKQEKLIEETQQYKRQLLVQQEKYEDRLTDMVRHNNEEFAAIEQRVKAAITRKDNKINELQEELQVTQLKARKLEELLEKQRREYMKL